MRHNKGGETTINRRKSHEPIAKQHAIDQMLGGSIILREPRTAEERELYRAKRSAILLASDGTYFTTLRPVESSLQPYVLRDDAKV